MINNKNFIALQHGQSSQPLPEDLKHKGNSDPKHDIWILLLWILWEYKCSNQQHPPFSFLVGSLVRVVVPAPPVLALGAGPGLLWTLDLISFERVVKAFSTLTASLAEVSKNLMPKESAKVFPSSVLTCLPRDQIYFQPAASRHSRFHIYRPQQASSRYPWMTVYQWYHRQEWCRALPCSMRQWWSWIVPDRQYPRFAA